jgi:transposase
MQVRNIPFKNGNSRDWTTERIERLTKQEMEALRANAERLGESALADLCTELLKRARTAVGKAKQKAGTPGRRLISRAKAFEARGAAAFPGHGNPAPADDELRRLRAENARLKAERDLLKKAAAYFANPPS